MFHGNLSTGKLIWAALTTDEANLIDLIKFGQGNRFSLEQLNDEFSRVNLAERYRRFQVPIFFVLGRYDCTSPRCWGKNISRSSRRLASAWYGSSSPRTTRPSRNRKNSTV
jgi:hypothetical protein